MNTVEAQLEQAVQESGQVSPVAQIDHSGKSLKELYLERSTEQEDGLDFVIELLQKAGLTLTRENYLGFSYPDGVPEDLDETSLPREIRV